MLFIRSLAFNLVFIIATLLQMLLYAPVYFFLPHRYACFFPKLWARVSLFLLKIIAGIDMRIDGLEYLPKGKAYIIAPKHQSAWETFALLPYLDDPSYVLKRELMWIPGFGSYMYKMGMIPINRGAPIRALKQIISSAKQKIAAGRQILIFPEGTRREPGASPDYKIGIVSIYDSLKIPVVAIAHNAGLYWPKGSFFKYQGVIKVKILPPIEAGLDKKTFLKMLIERTETACDELLLSTAQQSQKPPMPLAACIRLGQLAKGKVNDTTQ